MEVQSGITEKFAAAELQDDENQAEEKEIARSREATPPVKVPNIGNSEIDLRIQAQEHMYRHTLTREKNKVSLHALEEVGRSISAISQRRRQYFLDYKTCNSIRQVRQWFAWETKRNIDTNQASETKAENAATRGLKVFLNKVEFYGTLLARFGEYLVSLLMEHYSVEHEENFEVSKTKERMLALQEECQTLLSDNHEVILKTVNVTEIENKFPVISILPRVHETLCQMTDTATLWRLHARFAQMFENIILRRSKLESVRQLDEKKEVLKNMESQIRLNKYDISEVERDLKQKEAAMASTEFSEIYTKCSERIDDLSDMADERKLEIKSLDTTIKYLHEKTETFKKMIAHKRKEKLEMNVRKREDKLRELNRILAEIARLEEHKKNLDLKEEMWLRGGFEQELGIMQDLKNKLGKLQKGVQDMEEERNKVKESYHKTREQVMELDAEHDRLTHEYEYVKRLSVTMLPSLWNTTVFSQLPVNSAKPNQITQEKMKGEDAYDMNQPKGVAMIVSNDEPPAPKIQPKSKLGIIDGSSPQPSTVSASASGGNAQRGRTPAVINCLSTLCTQLGFYIIQRQHLSADALRHNMAAMSDQYHSITSSLNSLLVVVAARSDEWGRSMGGDGSVDPISVGEYLQHFTHDRCPALLGKPKIFLFLLRVTEHEPRIPQVGRIAEEKEDRKKDSLFSTPPTSASDFFQPEPLDVSEYGDDIVVIRVMYQNDGGGDAPTFGGTVTTNIDKLPWHVQVLIGTLLEQAGYKDFLSLLEYVKEEVALGPKTVGTSPMTKKEGEKDIVEIFIDHSLKKKLFFLPGI